MPDMSLSTAMFAVWVVVQPVLNMHSRPSREADVVSQAIYSDQVALVDAEGTWVRIRTTDDYLGWAPVEGLLNRDRPYASGEHVVRVENLYANLYREPDVTAHAPLLTLPFESRLEVLSEPEGEDRRWIEVILPDENRAWVQRGDVSFRRDSLTVGQTVADSRRFVGLPYLWGGTSSFGFDCSGFTQMLCRRRGIRIPRDAGPQSRWDGAIEVERDRLEPGDLLFFGESREKVTHTGMYLGDGRFVHATSYKRPMVRISELSDPHWSELLVACRRVSNRQAKTPAP
ncbi:MAG: C40 family peptidase, partial [bacterium]|nr:C40 family peptidase [bacterium]